MGLETGPKIVLIGRQIEVPENGVKRAEKADFRSFLGTYTTLFEFRECFFRPDSIVPTRENIHLGLPGVCFTGLSMNEASAVTENRPMKVS